PSAHLDAESEAVLLRTLRRLAETALVVVVAHRDAVVEVADQVVEVRASGTGGVAASDPPGPDAALATPAVPPAAPRGARVATSTDEVEDPARWGVRTGTVLGALSVTSGVALTATAAWLIT